MRVHGIRDSFRVEAHPLSSDKPRLLIAHYHPQMSGEYTIFVRWSGVHVPGSPFTVLIREGHSHTLTHIFCYCIIIQLHYKLNSVFVGCGYVKCVV